MTTAERKKLIAYLRKDCNGPFDSKWKAADELARLSAENKRLSDDKEFLMPELARLSAKIAELQKKAAIVDTLEKLLIEFGYVEIDGCINAVHVDCVGVGFVERHGAGPDLATALAKAAGESS